ncbi:MAG TPA: 4-hydroxy-tetrahydrodipicolinate synthase [Candidatus Baltobacteraceae bacterium]|nr:4-hydroxy-tetrahydrodipicolinate synthase [Candidatus Baltobacteraceae bacterium]
MSRLGTILTAMITPFDERGALDGKEAARVARWLVDRGNDGLVVAGSTGEGMTLDAAERRELIAAVKESVRDQARVIANVGTSDTRSTVRAAKEARDAGADALLVVVPPYNKPTQGGMLEHFGAVAEATPLPVAIYNIPSRTAANMLPSTLLELSRRHANIAAVKESSGDLKQIATIVRDRAPGFTVWCGDDHLYLPALAVGADGVVGVASHLCSREFRDMTDAYRSGDTVRATEIHNGLLELFEALFAITNPIPIKWAMAELGFRVGRCRSPLDALPEGAAERLRPLVASYLTTAP